MKNLVGLTLLLCLLSSTTTLATGKDCVNNGDPDAIKNVHSQRQIFNQAIAEKDLQSIKNIFHEDVILVTGTDSDVFSGADAQLAIWRDDFWQCGSGSVCAHTAMYSCFSRCTRGA
jgi:hypothetical protein